jgi:hypothetical protein
VASRRGTQVADGRFAVVALSLTLELVEFLAGKQR